MTFSPDIIPGPSALPYWMQLFAFIAGGLFTILTIFILISQLIKKPVLEFRLTREIFFRITENQEAIFSNGVLLAKNQGVSIKRVDFALNKIDSPAKYFSLRVAYFGEKVRGLYPISDFNFFTTSPLSFIPVIIPQRIVYFLSQESYEKNIQRAFSDFRIELQRKYQFFKNSAPRVEPSRQAQEATDFITSINSLYDIYAGRIMESIQLERGQYELKADIIYTSKKILFFGKSAKVSSKISFKIDSDAKESLRSQLIITLSKISQNIIFVTNNPVTYPEYNPIDIQELENG